MRISVIGTGYVGLVTATGLASSGHNVIAVDIDKTKVDLINQGKAPICEDGLDDLLFNCVKKSSNLMATSDYREISATEVSLICVSTPSNSDGSIDLSFIKDSAKEIGKVLGEKNAYHTVVVRSTVIPGTTKDIVIPALEEYSQKRLGADFSIAVNPEFMQEGKALHSFFQPDRIIIGQYDQRAGEVVEQIYQGISAPILRVDITTAEMIKYASNAFLATKISFINEIGNICQRLGVDIYAVAKGISFDYRIGDRFLNAGVGFGGSCLPKDLRALLFASSDNLGYHPSLLEAVYNVNRNQILKMIRLTEQKLRNLANRRIAILGLAFKPNTDDIRAAPAIEVIRRLLEKGAKITAYDPRAMPNASKVLPEVSYCASAAEAIDNSECILVLTEWDEFRNESLYQGKIVIDGRRVLNPERAKTFCDYQGICW